VYIYIGTIARRIKIKNIGLSKADRYEVIRVVLLKYKDLKGDMSVPAKFVVPVNDITWPKETWSMKLGSVVSTIRAGKSHVDKWADLESIGFDFNSQRLHYRYEAIRAALLKYKDLKCNMLVPAKFVVPTNDITWPEEMWDMKLGRVVMSIRTRKSHVDKRKDLESIGFDFNPQQNEFEAIRAALMKYKELKGDILVLQKFVVPTNDITWPKETCGVNLGIVVSVIRAGKCYVDKWENLESIGFNYDSQSLSYGYKLVKVALQTYKDLNGDMLVPYLFIVPKDDVKWPEEAWGMKLGIVVRSIRYGNCHVDKREDLESIGFDYSPQEIGTEFPSEKECRRILEEIHFPLIFEKVRPEWLKSPITSWKTSSFQ
jgi:hypothetical protein